MANDIDQHDPEVIAVEAEQEREIDLIIEQFSGPVLPPTILKQYNDIDPTFANRLIELTEKEQTHRHKSDHELLVVQSDDFKRNYTYRMRGQLYGFVISIVSIVCGVFLVSTDHEVFGGLLSLSSIAVLAGVFVKAHLAEKNDKN